MCVRCPIRESLVAASHAERRPFTSSDVGKSESLLVCILHWAFCLHTSRPGPLRCGSVVLVAVSYVHSNSPALIRRQLTIVLASRPWLAPLNDCSLVQFQYMRVSSIGPSTFMLSGSSSPRLLLSLRITAARTYRLPRGYVGLSPCPRRRLPTPTNTRIKNDRWVLSFLGRR